jgi:two-component sensor histidine kinase
MAIEMFEAANKADDEMQEQLELQDEVIQSAFLHQLTTLSLVSDVVSYRGSNESDAYIRGITDASVKRIAALSMLEDCIYYQSGVSVADLHKYMDNILPVLLESSSVPAETIVTINEITSILLPTEIATPLSIVIYELLENCLKHAFESDSPANYIHIKMNSIPGEKPTQTSLELSIQDSGIGLPDTIEDLALANSGIGIVQNIVKKLQATMQCQEDGGTRISITFPLLDIS